MKLSDYVIRFLKNSGISKVFTVSGGGCMHLIDSLSKAEGMEYICTHHEQAAAMAAEGYARMNNGIGAILVTTGPGGVNALNGVLGSWLDSIPMIVISGQVSLSQTTGLSGCRQIGDQEFDIVPMVKHMTKFAIMVRNKDLIGKYLMMALEEACRGRPGPVWVDIPLDIQSSEIDESLQPEGYIVWGLNRESPTTHQENKILDLLHQSKRPLIVAGNGVRISGAQEELRTFSKLYKIPVVTSCHSAVDLVNESDPYYCGRFGILGQPSANKIVQECDLLISVGSRLIMKTTGYNVDNFAKNAKKVVVDIDPYEIAKHKFPIDVKIQSDSWRFFKSMRLRMEDFTLPDREEWLTHCKELRSKDSIVASKHRQMKDYTSMYYFIDRLSAHLHRTGNKIPVVLANGAAHVITHHAMKMYGDQRVFTNVGCASMGYGLPAAIGACIANKKQPVICIEGDGSIMMNLQELQTVNGYRLPLKIFLINNHGYSSIVQTQQTFFKRNLAASTPCTGVTFPSFSNIADAFGLDYFSIRDNTEVDHYIQQVLEYGGPCLCEIYAHPNEPFEPKVMPKGTDKDGKIIPGDLTDMYVSEGFNEL